MSDRIDNVDDELTEEERAALEFDDADEKTAVFDPDAVPDPAAVAEPAPAAAEVDPDLPPVVEPDAVPAVPEAEAAPEPEAKPEPAKQEAAPVHAPILIVQAPEDAQAKLAEIAAKRDEAFQKFDDGEITNAQYNKQLNELNDQQLDIKLQVERASMAAAMEEQRIQNEWVADCNKFVRDHPEYKHGGEKYNQDRFNLLNEIIRDMTKMPENFGIANEVALDKAHKRVMNVYGDSPAEVVQAKTPGKVVQHNIPKPPAPPTLGNLPAASMNDDTGGEFASLERLGRSGDVDAYEAALEKLSEAQMARFLKA